jgi:hypothetical protein
MNRSTALITAGALAAVPLGILVTAGSAQAGGREADAGEKERRGVCAAGSYEFQVDYGFGGFEVNADLDRVTPGSTWVVVLKQDGKRFSKVTRTADREGDLEVEAFRGDSAGSDTFRFKARPSSGGAGCAATITYS